MTSSTPLHLFSVETQTKQPPICPECGKTIIWRTTQSTPYAIGIAIALDPLPAGRAGDYVMLDHQNIRLRSAADSTNQAIVTYCPHARSCTRSPF